MTRFYGRELARLASLLVGTAAAAAAIPVAPPPGRNVVIVVVDGVRWSDGLGDPAGATMPLLASRLAPQGVEYTHFLNAGQTLTTAGHAAILTGAYESISDSATSSDHPLRPTVFERWRKATLAPAKQALLLASKRKICHLSSSRDPKFGILYGASSVCAAGMALRPYQVVESDRDDEASLTRLKLALRRDQPRVVLLHLAEPDTRGHAGDRAGYLGAIRRADGIVWRLWSDLQRDPHYRGVTDLIVTSDHGRHLDGVGNGFRGHGDQCEGCRHVMMVALGPDFERGRVIAEPRELVDIAPTVAAILGFAMPPGQGRVLDEALLLAPAADVVARLDGVAASP